MGIVNTPHLTSHGLVFSISLHYRDVSQQCLVTSVYGCRLSSCLSVNTRALMTAQCEISLLPDSFNYGHDSVSSVSLSLSLALSHTHTQSHTHTHTQPSLDCYWVLHKDTQFNLSSSQHFSATVKKSLKFLSPRLSTIIHHSGVIFVSEPRLIIFQRILFSLCSLSFISPWSSTARRGTTNTVIKVYTQAKTHTPDTHTHTHTHT